jgi:hypothetical protein
MQAQAQAQALAQPMTPARVAGPGSPNGVIEVGCFSIAFLEMDELLRIARIAQSVTPVTVIHSTASAQSRVATLHLIVHELLALLVVPVAIAMPAPHGFGDRIGRGAAVPSCPPHTWSAVLMRSWHTHGRKTPRKGFTCRMLRQ